MRRFLPFLVLLVFAVHAGTLLAADLKLFGKTELPDGAQPPVLEQTPQIIWSQPPDFNGAFAASQIDDCYPFEAEVVDDFFLSQPAWIVGLRWWGGYFNGDPLPGGFPMVRVRLFYRSEAGPGEIYDECETPEAGQWDVENIFEYWISAFVFLEPGHYWVSVTPIFCYPPQWGWLTSSTHNLEQAHMKFPLMGYHDYTPFSQIQGLEAYWDVSFEIESFPEAAGVADQVPGMSSWISVVAPNPFNPVTRLEYSAGTTQHVRLQVYNLSGRLVRSLLDETAVPGVQHVEWDGRDDNGNSVSSGIYSFRLIADGEVSTVKGILLR